MMIAPTFFLPTNCYHLWKFSMLIIVLSLCSMLCISMKPVEQIDGWHQVWWGSLRHHVNNNMASGIAKYQCQESWDLFLYYISAKKTLCSCHIVNHKPCVRCNCRAVLFVLSQCGTVDSEKLKRMGLQVQSYSFCSLRAFWMTACLWKLGKNLSVSRILLMGMCILLRSIVSWFIVFVSLVSELDDKRNENGRGNSFFPSNRIFSG